MLAVLGDYLKHLNCEIESYEQLIAQKREEAQKLAQLQGQVVEALSILKNVVDELQTVDPDAIATIQTAAFEIFKNQDNNGKLHTSLPDVAPTTTIELTTNEDSLKIDPNEASLAEAENEDSHQESHCIRLSENVVYEPEKAHPKGSAKQIVYAGINAYNRAKAWGERLCFNHTVGTRFEVNSHSRSQSYSYDLTVYGMENEDIQQLVSCDLTEHPGIAENASWQPPKRLPQAAPPRPQVCQAGDLAVGDMARKDDGRE